jgi:multidrug resistance efflux pump
LLFEIDPRTFEVSLAQARAQLDETGEGVQALEKQVEAARAAVQMSRASVQQVESSIKELDAQIEANRAEYERQQELLPRRSTSQKAVDQARAAYEVSIEQRNGTLASLAQAEASVRQSEAAHAEAGANLGSLGESNTRVRAALAAVRQAELNLEFTKVKAPVDGYVTNLNLRLGSQAVANQPALALVDVASYWVHGFFKETSIADIGSGDRAIVTLMSYPDTPLDGRVESIGWGISQQDGSTGFELLPNVNPTFEWIRLAQRVPVRIHLIDVPEEIELRVGTTASVLVMTGTGTSDQVSDKAVPAAPSALQ